MLVLIKGAEHAGSRAIHSQLSEVFSSACSDVLLPRASDSIPGKPGHETPLGRVISRYVE